MNFTGSRPTWIANVCALVVACVIIIEMLYVEHARYGVFRPFDALGALVPALVMIIIRNSIFSYCFLFCYVALAIDGFFQAQKYFSGDYIIPGSAKPAFMLFGAFIGFSILCLAIYAVGALIWFSVRRLRPIARKLMMLGISIRPVVRRRLMSKARMTGSLRGLSPESPSAVRSTDRRR